MVDDVNSLSRFIRSIPVGFAQSISRVCRLPPRTGLSEWRHKAMTVVDTLRAIKRVMFFSPTGKYAQYDLIKTVVELAKLSNEVKGYIAELRFDFDEGKMESSLEPEEYKKIHGRTFEYTQMEPQNRFVTQVLRQREEFQKKHRHCRQLYDQDKREHYSSLRDETLERGRDLLKEIEEAYFELPTQLGYGGL